MRYHVGDDRAWADPSFDDSSWPTISTSQTLRDAGLGKYSGYLWYRFRVKLPTTAPMAIGIVRDISSYELFADGKQIGSWGSMSGSDLHYASSPQIFPFPGEPRPLVSVAVRMRIEPGASASHMGDVAGIPQKGVTIGTAQDLKFYQEYIALTLLANSAMPSFIDLIGLLLTVFLLVLYGIRRQQTENLFLGLYFFLYALSGALQAGSYLGAFPLEAGHLVPVSEALSAMCLIEFFYRFSGERRNWLVRCVELTVLLVPIAYVAYLFDKISYSDLYSLSTILYLVLIGYSLAVSIVYASRKNREAAILIAPLFLAFAGRLLERLHILLFVFGGPVRLATSIPFFHFGRFRVASSELAQLLFYLAILLILFLRLQRVSVERERSVGELEAARLVQRKLIPEVLPDIPGFAVDFAYIPASEVGGDFFHITPTPGGGLLVVVGDVAGKGLQAAMTVSTLMGAVRATHSTSPAAVLGELGRAVAATGRLTTCFAAHIESNPLRITMASAGHLPPYLNQQELALDPHLPLGIAPDLIFAESSQELHPGDRLLLVTDGVVEAQDKKGTLFGFDRLAGISGQSATAIADAARLYGQNDDITVLTLICTA
jgi:hypothetical protein